MERTSWRRSSEMSCVYIVGGLTGRAQSGTAAWISQFRMASLTPDVFVHGDREGWEEKEELFLAPEVPF